MSGGLSELWERYTRTKPIDEVQEEAETSELARELGAWDLVVLGLGAMIGAGIFVALGQGVVLAGPAVSLAFVVAAVGCIFAALCYAELSSAIPASGMAYSYTFVTLGQLMAWLIAWNLIAEYMIGNVAVAAAWSDNLQQALTTVNIDLPAALQAAPGTAPGALFDLPAFLIVAAVTGLLAIGVRESATTNAVLTAVKVGALFLFIALAAVKADPGRFTDFAPRGAGGVLTAAGVVFFAFIGFDAVAAAAEETKDPQRDLPIGIIGSLVAVTILYVGVSLAFVGVGGSTGGAALATALGQAGYGEIWEVIMAFAAVAATTSVLLVFQLGIPRILMSLSRDQLLPEGLGEIHQRFATPFKLTLLTGLLTALGAALIPFGDALAFTSLATLFVFLVVSLAVLVLRRKRPDLERPFSVPAAPFVVLGAVVALGGMMISLGAKTWLYFGAWMGLGLVAYGLYGSKRGLMGPEEDVEVITEPIETE